MTRKRVYIDDCEECKKANAMFCSTECYNRYISRERYYNKHIKIRGKNNDLRGKRWNIILK